MSRLCAVSLILLALTVDESAGGKRFLGFPYEEIRSGCPESARTARGSEFILRTRKSQGCIPMGDNQGGALKKARLLEHPLPIVFLIHDFGSNARDAWVQATQYHLVHSEHYHAFAFNWRADVSVTPAIAKAAAADLVTFIRQLIQHGTAPQESIHLVGFGLGAHLAGFAGKELQKLTPSILIGRITGLDPAGSEFENATESDRLDSTDAKTVDVIHTNAFDWKEKVRLDLGLVKTSGISKPIGHVDFYPNGGMVQPKCEPNDHHENHRKATEYFFLSIVARAWVFGLPCQSYEMFTSGGCGVCAGNCYTMGLKFGLVLRQHNPNPKSADAIAAGSRYYLTTPSDWLAETRPWLIRLNATSGLPAKPNFAAMLSISCQYGIIKNEMLTDKHSVMKSMTKIVYSGSMHQLRLKISASEFDQLQSVTVKATDILFADEELFGATNPQIGHFVQLKRL